MKSERTVARDRFLVGVFSLSSVIASSWIADAMNGQCLWQPLIGPCGVGSAGGATLSEMLPRLVVAVLLFWTSIVLLYRTAKGLLPVRHLARTPAVEAHRVLITAISPFRPAPIEEDCGWVIEENGTGRRVVLSDDLDRDIEAFSKLDWNWNGQQFLRCLRPHRSKLCRLVLIGTPGEGGSFDSRETVQKIAAVYFPKAEIIAHPRAIGPEEIEALQTCFDEYIQEFQAEGFEQREIILDVTGGQKTTSIAAALTTLRWEQIEFQYVQTAPDPPGSEIRAIGFNLVADSSPRGFEV